MTGAENFMIGAFREVYVMDWGIARRISAPSRATTASSDARALPHRRDVPRHAGAARAFVHVAALPLPAELAAIKRLAGRSLIVRGASQRTIAGHTNPQFGGVCFAQLFGSSLNLNLHFQLLQLNGYYAWDEELGRFDEWGELVDGVVRLAALRRPSLLFGREARFYNAASGSNPAITIGDGRCTTGVLRW